MLVHSALSFLKIYYQMLKLIDKLFRSIVNRYFMLTNVVEIA